MKYFHADKEGIREIVEYTVEECILKCIDEKTGEKIKIVMDKKRFNEWREKLMGEK